MHKITLFLILLTLLSCSDLDPNKVLVGKWILLEGETRYPLTIDDSLKVFPDWGLPKEEPPVYQLTKHQDGYLLEDHSPENIGPIKTLEKDLILFENGLCLIRLNEATKTSQSFSEFRNSLSNAILEYEFEDMTTRLYLTDSLNHYGNNETGIVRIGGLERASLGLQWWLADLNGTFTLWHTSLYAGIEQNIIVIQSIDEHSFTGTLYDYDLEFPVVVKMIDPQSKEKMDSISQVLVQTEWETTSTSEYDIREKYPDLVVEEVESFIKTMESEKKELISKEEFPANPFTFSFKENGVLDIQKFGQPSITSSWHLTPDARYIILGNDYWRQLFGGVISLPTLDSLSFESYFKIAYQDSMYYQDELKFILQAKH